MKNTERIIGIIAFVSFILLQFDILGSRLLFTLSAFILSIIYLFLGFFIVNGIPLVKSSKSLTTTNSTSYEIVTSILFGIFSSSLLIGIIFTVNHYPGNDFIIMIGLIWLILLTIISLIKVLREKDKYNMHLLIRGIILILWGILVIII